MFLKKKVYLLRIKTVFDIFFFFFQTYYTKIGELTLFYFVRIRGRGVCFITSLRIFIRKKKFRRLQTEILYFFSFAPMWNSTIEEQTSAKCYIYILCKGGGGMGERNKTVNYYRPLIA